MAARMQEGKGGREGKGPCVTADVRFPLLLSFSHSGGLIVKSRDFFIIGTGWKKRKGRKTGEGRRKRGGGDSLRSEEL